KDDILSGAFRAGQISPYAAIYLLLFLVGLGAAGLTAFYTFRAYFLTFWGEEKIPHEAGHHAHESPRVMTVPLMVLAVGAIFAGFINADPFTHALASFLHRSPELALLPHGDMNWGERSLLWLGSIVMALGGIGVAWWMYQKQRGFADKLAGDAPALYQLSLNKFYLDELYAAFIVQPMAGLAAVCR